MAQTDRQTDRALFIHSFASGDVGCVPWSTGNTDVQGSVWLCFVLWYRHMPTSPRAAPLPVYLSDRPFLQTEHSPEGSVLCDVGMAMLETPVPCSGPGERQSLPSEA